MKKTSLKDFLEGSIPEELIKNVNRSYEIVGDIAIIELIDDLLKYEKQIGEALLKTNKSIKTVLKKSGVHHGEFRTQNLEYVTGENKKETIYLENQIRLKINPETVYFSARLSTERSELMKNIKENSRILVMFSGAGPYTFVAMRNQPSLSRITSIEINPEGHKYALESLNLNRNLIKRADTYQMLLKFLKENDMPIYEKVLTELLNNLTYQFYNGDVRKEIANFKLEPSTEKIENYHNKLFEQNPKDIIDFLNQSDIKTIHLNLDEKINKEKLKNIYILISSKFNFICTINNQNFIFNNDLSKNYLLNILENKTLENIEKYDEIFMPLPKDAELFLDCAFKTADKNAIVHMYDFVHENDYPQQSENAVKEAAKKHGKKIQILQTRKVGQYSPRKFRVCCDFQVIE